MNNRRSLYIVLALSVATAAWFASGAVEPKPHERRAAAPVEHAPAAPVRVQVRTLSAEPVTEHVVVQGHTAPSRVVSIRAEAAGRVTALLARRGATVQEDQPVVRLSADDRPARLRKAEALLRQRAAEHASSEELAREGHLARTQVHKALADLEGARADLESIELDIRNTTLRAPFDGILNARAVEIGDYVALRDEVFTIVDVDPLVVVVHVSQHDIGAFTVGKASSARLVNGVRVEGAVRFVSATAQPATRTFPVEIEIANPDGALPAGTSAEVSVAARTVDAHSISPAWMARDAAGDIGVYVAAEDARARFLPVRIVRATPDAVWVAGLPSPVRVITTGQGFVHAGAPIESVAVGSASSGIGSPLVALPAPPDEVTR